jgi:autotransporter adhesin
MALGIRSVASATSSVAIGREANAGAINSVALGANSIATEPNTVSIGQPGARRRIVNVADAIAGTDAVNLNQVNDLIHNMGAVFIGIGATAVDTGTAVGDLATANFAAASAYGFGANAAAVNATAIGTNSVASSINSTAVGAGAQATHANSTAIGTGAATSAPNQVMLGSAGSTIAMPGVANPASRLAQRGPTGFVTSDSSGNLATTTFTPDDLLRQDRRLKDGVALALAAGGVGTLQPGRRYALNLNYGNFDGAGAIGVGATGLIHDGRSYAVLVNAGVGVGFNTGVVGGRGGFSVQW